MPPFFYNHARLSPAALGLLLLATLYALGPLHSKILGLAWFLFSVAGIVVARRLPARHESAAPLAHIARIWLIACFFSLCLQSIGILYWQDTFFSVANPQLRLLLPAVATYMLLKKEASTANLSRWMLNALAVACFIAAGRTLYLSFAFPDTLRRLLATNAIPWAVAISFLVCLLLPIAATASNRHRKYLWHAASACAVVAVLLTGSRGAWFIVPWYFFLLVWFFLPARINRWVKVLSACSISFFSCTLILVVTFWLTPKDNSRLHQIHQETTMAANHNYNTSIGARWYLWGMAVQDIRQSPWIGMGEKQRLARIKNAGKDAPPAIFDNLAEVRSVGHAHNQYLHCAWDYGVLGIVSILVLLGGLFMMIMRLATLSDAGKVAAWQLGGVVLMHGIAGMTNVNFAHNYYALALSLAVVIPLLGVHRETS